MEPVIYELKRPWSYTKDKTLKHIEFREPTGNDCSLLLKIIALITKADDALSPELIAPTLELIDGFGSIVGDPEMPIATISGRIALPDLIGIATEIVPDFLD